MFSLFQGCIGVQYFFLSFRVSHGKSLFNSVLFFLFLCWLFSCFRRALLRSSFLGYTYYFSFTAPEVGSRSLTTHRQAFLVADTSQGFDLLQPLEIIIFDKIKCSGKNMLISS